MTESKLQEIMMSRGYDRSQGEWDSCEIYPNVYVGSLQASLDVDNLRRHNIKGVLTVANHLQVNLPEDISHLQLDIADHPCANILEILPDALVFITKILQTSNIEEKEEGGGNGNGKDAENEISNRSILIHCASGISRSVSVCCAWLMIEKNMTFDESIQLVRENRPRANPNLGFRQQLSYLEKHNNVVSVACQEYNLNYRENNILDVIKKQRDEINEIYSQVDAIENDIKKSTTEVAQTKLSSWKSDLYRLQSLLDRISQESAQNPLYDPPSISIRKSAAEKVIRLLEDVEAIDHK